MDRINDKIDFLYHIWKNGILNKENLIMLYDLDPKEYNYDKHIRDSRLEEILKSRNIRKDLASIIECPEEQIAFINEKMSPVVEYVYTGLHIIKLGTNEVLNGKMIDVIKYLNYENNNAIVKDCKEVYQDANDVANNDRKNVNNTNELLEKCKKRSCVPKYACRPYRKIKKEKNIEEMTARIGKVAKCFAAASVVVTTGVNIVMANNDVVNKYVEEHRHIITDEKLRTADNNGFYYLHSNIAKNILNENNDTDALIYVVYKEVKKDASNLISHDDDQIDYNMNLIIRDISRYSDNYDYNNFDEYLEDKKYMNKEGKIDFKVYDENMHNYILKMLSDNNYVFDGEKLDGGKSK